MTGLGEGSNLAPLTADEARQHILDQIEPLGAVSKLLIEAMGDVLAESVIAPVSAPAFNRSAMDGYAMAWADVSGVTDGSPVTLPVAFEVAAGLVAEDSLQPGHAARIMTGARVPDGADAIVKQEDARDEGGRVTILSIDDAGPGHYVRSAGSFFSTGNELLGPGQVLESGALGLLAAIGHTVVNVHRRPRVAVIATGDELVELHETPGVGQIRNSNAYMLAALISEAGGVPIVMPIARDTVEDCRARFVEALESADLVVSIGGVSVGDYDVVRTVMLDLQAGMGFWKVKARPGKPLAFGILSGTPTIGLPGNPVSSFVSFYQFVRPAIRRMRGFVESGRLPVVRARLTRPVAKSPYTRRDYQRGRLYETDSELGFEPFADQDSGNLTSIVSTSGFGVVPIGVTRMIAGDPIEVERIPGAPIYRRDENLEEG